MAKMTKLAFVPVVDIYSTCFNTPAISCMILLVQTTFIFKFHSVVDLMFAYFAFGGILNPYPFPAQYLLAMQSLPENNILATGHKSLFICLLQ